MIALRNTIFFCAKCWRDVQRSVKLGVNRQIKNLNKFTVIILIKKSKWTKQNLQRLVAYSTVCVDFYVCAKRRKHFLLQLPHWKASVAWGTASSIHTARYWEKSADGQHLLNCLSVICPIFKFLCLLNNDFYKACYKIFFLSLFSCSSEVVSSLQSTTPVIIK